MEDKEFDEGMYQKRFNEGYGSKNLRRVKFILSARDASSSSFEKGR